MTATQTLFTISCILFVAHVETHYLAPVPEIEANVMGLAEHDVTQAIVLLSAK